MSPAFTETKKVRISVAENPPQRRPRGTGTCVECGKGDQAGRVCMICGGSVKRVMPVRSHTAPGGDLILDKTADELKSENQNLKDELEMMKARMDRLEALANQMMTQKSAAAAAPPPGAAAAAAPPPGGVPPPGGAPPPPGGALPPGGISAPPNLPPPPPVDKSLIGKGGGLGGLLRDLSSATLNKIDPSLRLQGDDGPDMGGLAALAVQFMKRRQERMKKGEVRLSKVKEVKKDEELSEFELRMRARSRQLSERKEKVKVVGENEDGTEKESDEQSEEESDEESDEESKESSHKIPKDNNENVKSNELIGQQTNKSQTDNTLKRGACPKCGRTENPGKFCVICGTKLPTQQIRSKLPVRQKPRENLTAKGMAPSSRIADLQQKTQTISNIIESCPKCGKSDNPGKFCVICGTILKKNSPPQNHHGDADDTNSSETQKEEQKSSLSGLMELQQDGVQEQELAKENAEKHKREKEEVHASPEKQPSELAQPQIDKTREEIDTPKKQQDTQPEPPHENKELKNEVSESESQPIAMKLANENTQKHKCEKEELHASPEKPPSEQNQPQTDQTPEEIDAPKEQQDTQPVPPHEQEELKNQVSESESQPKAMETAETSEDGTSKNTNEILKDNETKLSGAVNDISQDKIIVQSISDEDNKTEIVEDQNEDNKSS